MPDGRRTHLRTWRDLKAHGDLPTIVITLPARWLATANVADALATAATNIGSVEQQLRVDLPEMDAVIEQSSFAGRPRELHDLGLRFGPGAVPLHHLLALPVNVLMLRAAVEPGADGDQDARQHEILRAMTQLGHQLSLTIVADGITTAAQRGALRALGVDRGYEPSLSPTFPATTMAIYLRRIASGRDTT